VVFCVEIHGLELERPIKSSLNVSDRLNFPSFFRRSFELCPCRGTFEQKLVDYTRWPICSRSEILVFGDGRDWFIDSPATLKNTSLTSPFTSDPFRNTSCSSFHDALSEWEMEAPLPPPPRFQGKGNKFVEAEAWINEIKQDRESVAISGSRRTCDHFWDMIEGSTIENTISL